MATVQIRVSGLIVTKVACIPALDDGAGRKSQLLTGLQSLRPELASVYE